jgi:hypothetical protein
METITVAEIHCFSCGYTPATIVQVGLSPNLPRRLSPARNGPGMRKYPRAAPRCGRCDGPLFVEAMVA